MSRTTETLFYLVVCASISTFPHSSGDKCPNTTCVCSLTLNDTISDCRSRHLDYIPECVSNLSEVIDFSDNNILILEKIMFHRFTFAKTLYLIRCRIELIEKKCVLWLNCTENISTNIE